jgi:glycosyltransferase involved in cell wall biosynthesis
VGLDLVKSKGNLHLEKIVRQFQQSHQKILLYVGVIDHRRDVGFLIDILAKLNEKKNTFGLIIVGKGGASETVEKKISKHGLGNDVLWFRSILNDEIHIFFEGSDLFLLPTNYEIWGMVLLESLYFGCPVLSTKEAGPKDILVKSEFGKCLKFDLQTWVEAINLYCKTNNFKLKKDRKRYVISCFNWFKLANRYKLIVEKK